jgi:hypothetical protein
MKWEKLLKMYAMNISLQQQIDEFNKTFSQWRQKVKPTDFLHYLKFVARKLNIIMVQEWQKKCMIGTQKNANYLILLFLPFLLFLYNVQMPLFYVANYNLNMI